MFRLPKQDYEWPGTVQVMVPGQAVPVPHPVRWRYRSDEQINGLLAQSGAALLRVVVVGFHGIADPDGARMDFSPENLDKLCDIPFWRRSAIDSYVKAVAGLPDLNSATPPADGDAAETASSGSSPKTAPS